MRANRLLTLAWAALLGCCAGLPVQVAADDTEIYLGADSISSGVLPNVLFILDTSGSMSDTDGHAKDRMDRMKDALYDILDQTNSVNVGLMRFTDPGGPILFPVSDIAADANEVTSQGQADVTVYVTDGNDDAEELDGEMMLDSPVLDLVYTPTYGGEGSVFIQIEANEDDAEQSPTFANNNSDVMQITDDASGNRTNGLRFRDVQIPQGSVIHNATLDFYASNSNSVQTDLTFIGHLVPDAPAFPNGPVADSPFDRLGELTTATVPWSNVPPWTGGERYQTPNIAELIQEIVAQPTWVAGNAMAFLITGTDGSLRRASTHNDRSSRAAILRADFADNTKQGDQKVGLRFRNVRVPQGITITNAVIEFAATDANSEATDLEIFGEAVDDAAAFTSATNDISDRAKTVASVDWSVPAWAATNDVDQTPNLAAVVQEIVDRSGWCGGQDMAFIIENDLNNGPRRAYSYDNDPSRAPVLRIEYEETSSLADGEGCIFQELQSQVTASQDDAEQIDTDLYLTSDTLEMTTDGYGTRNIGYRFRDLDIANGATIVSAHLQFRAQNSDSDSTSLTFHGHNVDNSEGFADGHGTDVASRDLTTASETWANVESWTDGQWYTSPNLSSVVNEVVSRPGWEAGNDLSFIVSGSGLRRAHSYDDQPARAAVLKLVIKAVVSSGTNTALTTVRDRLKEIVSQLDHEGYTPIVDTLYEAARYYRGEGVHYGASRGDGGAVVERATRVSHPASYQGGSVSRADGCDDSNLNDDECRTETIDGSPIYISPIEEGCQANYIVLLTDGFANHNHSTELVKSMTGESACQTAFSNGETIADNDELCAVDLVKFLAENDQRTSVSGANTVSTYTIGFNISTQFLKDIATAGSGKFYEAQTSAQLASVFEQIIAEVKENTSSFAAPALSVNAFNKLIHRDEVYFSLFKPTTSMRWDGNVKKYRICEDPTPYADDPDTIDVDESQTVVCELGEVMDAKDPAEPAINPVDNRISDEALSFWSASTDGAEILLGGAGNEIPTYTSRRVYTYTDGGAPSSAVDLDGLTDPDDDTIQIHAITDSNDRLTVELLGGSTDTNEPNYMSPDDRTDLIEWIRGKDVVLGSGDRYAFNDPLHSSPVAVTYGGDNQNAVIKLFVGTNDGALRMLNGHNGTEEWAFIPQAMLAKQRALMVNSAGNHIYGIDGTPTVWVNDLHSDNAPPNGAIEPTVGVAPGDYDPDVDEFVRIYVGMRRGGDSVFAFDATPTVSDDGDSLDDPNDTTSINPTYLWRIDGGSASFPRLGQTWSQPKRIKVASGTGTAGEVVYRHALVFAGGYDEAQDNTFGPGGLGNAIYIVDANTGDRLFWVSGTAHGTSTDGIVVPDMTYPIPSDVATLDSNFDGIVDRVYVGDTGGQLWRLDLDADRSAAVGIKGTVAMAASISNDTNVADNRKFFYPPDVVQARSAQYAEKNYDLVSIVSGNRASPLNTTVQDRFYALREWRIDPLEDGDPDGEGTIDPNDTSDDDGLADNYTTVLGPITGQNGALIDLTDINGPVDQDLTDLQASNGYYIDLEDDGEKGLSSPVVLEGKVFFTTYLPDASASGSTCAIVEGVGRLYGFNVLNGAAAYNWDETGDDTVTTKSDRTYALESGIPSSAVPIFQEKGITLLIGGGGGATTVDPNIALPRVRTYWTAQGGTN